MPDPFGWLAKNVAGPMQQALTGEVPGLLARPLAGTRKQHVVPGGSSGAFLKEGHEVPTASELESFQEKIYPMAEAARARLAKSYEPGGANREAWIQNVQLSNPGAPRDVVERMYAEQVLPTIVSELKAPILRGSGGGKRHLSYFSPERVGRGSISIEPQGGWGTLESLLARAVRPLEETVGHELAHAGVRGTKQGTRLAGRAWPTEGEKAELLRKVEGWYDNRDDPYPVGWWQDWDEDRPPVLRDVGGDVQDLDKALLEELFGKYKHPAGGSQQESLLGPNLHAMLEAEQRGNLHSIRALLQEQRGSGEILPEDVVNIMQGGSSQPAGGGVFPEEEYYGGASGAGDLGWMLKNMLKVDPERAAEILNLISSRTPRARGDHERALSGSGAPLSSVLGRGWT